jgi:osmotically-inducible protein OsmY
MLNDDTLIKKAVEDHLFWDDELNEEVEQKIEKVLGWYPKLDRADISVSVEAGCVTLHGKVDSAAKWQWIENVVRGVTGVLDVRNEIAIIPTEPSSGPAAA